MNRSAFTTLAGAPACPLTILESAAALQGWESSARARERAWLQAEELRFAPGAVLVIRDDHCVDATRLEALTAATALALDLVNTPANAMGPQELSDATSRVAQAFDAQVALVVGEELLRQNYPLIHAVGRASAKPIVAAPFLETFVAQRSRR